MTADRIAVVTGATRGLGRATAVALARRGYGVVVTHRGDASAADVVLAEIAGATEGARAIALPLDLADPAAIARFADALPDAAEARWGRRDIDALVNNAGIGLFGTLDAVTSDDLDALFHTNVRGTMLVTQAVAPLIRDGGVILSLSTSLTRHVSVGTAAYTASKAAIESFSRVLARELGPRGIRVNTIAPGPTATDFNGGAQRDDESLRAFLAENTALGRVGEPGDVADAIVAALSDELRWMTAERIEVSGGALI